MLRYESDQPLQRLAAFFTFNILENPVIELFTTIGEALLFAAALAVMLFVAVALGM